MVDKHIRKEKQLDPDIRENSMSFVVTLNNASNYRTIELTDERTKVML